MKIQKNKIVLLISILLTSFLLLLVGCTDTNSATGISGENDPSLPFYIDQSEYFDAQTVYIYNLGTINADYLKDNMVCEPYVTLKITNDTEGKEERIKVVFPVESNTIYTLSVKIPNSENSYTRVIDEQIFSATIEDPAPKNLTSEDSVHLKMNDTISISDFESNLKLDGEAFQGTIEENDKQLTITPEEDWTIGPHVLKLSDAFVSESGKRLHTPAYFNFEVIDPDNPSSTSSEPYKADVSLMLDGRSEAILSSLDALEQGFTMSSGERFTGEPITITASLYQFDSLDTYQTDAFSLLDTDQPIHQSLVESKDITVLSEDFSSIDSSSFSSSYSTSSGHTVPKLIYHGQFDFGVLEQGAYIMEINTTDQERYTFDTSRRIFQVSDIALYLQTAKNETMAWANSIGNTRSFEGTTIEFSQFITPTGETTAYELQATGTLDSDGISFLHYPLEEAEKSGYETESMGKQVSLRDKEGNLIYVDATNVLSNYYSEPTNLYYSYLYLDRAMYRPTDTIQFWGFIQPYAHNENEMPDQVEVILDPSRLKLSVTVTPDENGTFQGEIPIETIKSANYAVSLVVKDGTNNSSYYNSSEESMNICDTVWIEVKNYTKPLFKISGTPDYALYLKDDTVNLTIEPAFFDGTPLPNYDVEFSMLDSSDSETITLTTDEEGKITHSFKASEGYYRSGRTYSWLPIYRSYMLKITDDGQVISYVGGFYFCTTDIILDSTLSKDENPTLTIQGNSFNQETLLSLKTRSADNRYFYYNFYGEDKASLTGEPLNDVKVSYSYTISYFNTAKQIRDKKEIENKTANLKNGVAEAGALIPSDLPVDFNQYLYISGNYKSNDSTNKSTQNYFYWSNYKGYSGLSQNQTPKGYYLYSEELIIPEEDQEYSFSNIYSSYSDSFFFTMENKQTTTFNLMKGDEQVQNEGTLLYTYVQNNVVDYGVTTKNELPFTESTEYANSVNLVSAYFDGKEVHALSMTRIGFDSESMELTIDIQSDAEEYRPGDTVKLDITVTGPDGKPRAANGSVGVVDEAMFALRDQYINVLDRLYGDMYFYNYNIQRYTTTVGDVKNENAMDGGKGDEDLLFSDTYRKNFKDTAFFQSYTTNSQGKAHLEFVLPDNTTSWRMTTVSVTNDLYGGQTKENFIATLPFFVQPVSNDNYLVGDEVSMLVQGHGTILNQDSEIEYTVQVLGDGVDLVKTLDNYAYKSNEVSFGKLEAGDYTLISTAQIDGYRDTVEKTFTVKKNNLDLMIHKKINPEDISTIDSSRYPLTLTFYDEANEAFFDSLSGLFTHYCGRLDQMMSRYTAKTALLEMSNGGSMPKHIAETSLDIADRQNSDGGIGWYIGDDSNLDLTTKMAQIAPERFDKNLMANYFRDIIGKTGASSQEIAKAYLGLAALGEDVANEIKEELSETSAVTIEEIYYITALSYTDAFEEATTLYNERIAIYLQGDERGKSYISPAFRSEDTAKTTAAWMAASRLNLPDANAISMYYSNQKWGINNIFEKMIYVIECAPTVEALQVSYTINGKEETLPLGSSGRVSKMFTKSEFESLAFTSVPENVQIMAYYMGEPEEAGLEQTDLFSVKKEISSISENEYIVKLTLTFENTAPVGEYSINEWIPSNMRMVERPKVIPNPSYSYYMTSIQEGQNVSIFYNRSKNSSSKLIITYKMKRTYEASAIVDRTYMLHLDTGENYLTDRYEFNAESVPPYKEESSEESTLSSSSATSSSNSTKQK